MSKPIVISGLLPEEFKSNIIEAGHKAYRAKQVLEWIYSKSILSFSQMGNISAPLRFLLEEKYSITSLIKSKVIVSQDRTKKYLFQTHDNEYIESVLIPSAKRMTVCISTQVGCAFGCVFCASLVAHQQVL